MICPICSADENWHSLKPYNPQRELLICKGCGFVGYRVDPDAEEKMREYYRKEYRPDPTVGNLLTTSNKLQYIDLFLKDFLKEKKDLVCGDVGCATGYLVNFLRKRGHKATGCEYTITYRRFAEHFYGIPITEELTEKHRYDFISIYHVLEHMIEPDKKLAKYVSLLADGGHIMVSTPKWFDVLEEASGTGIINDGMDLNAAFCKRYAKDHINCFSQNSIRRIFAKCGLVVVKENFTQYGQTYLLRRTGVDHPVELLQPEKWEDQLAHIDKERQALQFFIDKKYEQAAELYPKFPEAWMRLIFERYLKSPDKQAEQWKKVEEVLPDNARVRHGHAMWLYQRQDYKSCLNQLEWLMENKPNVEVLMLIGKCLINMGRDHEALPVFSRVAEMHPPHWTEAMNWACRCASRQPSWDERATAEIKEKFFATNKDKIKIEPMDPIFNSNGQKQEAEIGSSAQVGQEDTGVLPQPATEAGSSPEAA